MTIKCSAATPDNPRRHHQRPGPSVCPLHCTALHLQAAELYLSGSGLRWTIVRPGGLSDKPADEVGQLVTAREDSLFALDTDPGRAISRDTVRWHDDDGEDGGERAAQGQHGGLRPSTACVGMDARGHPASTCEKERHARALTGLEAVCCLLLQRASTCCCHMTPGGRGAGGCAAPAWRRQQGRRGGGIPERPAAA